MGVSQQLAWNQATSMMFMVLISSVLLAYVSSNPLDAGYGIPTAPLIFSQPPLPNVIPQPFFSTAPNVIPHTFSSPAVQPQFPIGIHNSPSLSSSIPFASTSVSSPIPLSLPVPVEAPFPEPSTPFDPAPFYLPTAPLAPAVPSIPSSQFHAQDEFGQFRFGYENIHSKKTESKDAFGVTRGSYQYVDANGVLQIVNYIADPINGFRVMGTNIPSAPAALPVTPLQAPEPVTDTPEVAKAKAEHLEAFAKATNAPSEKKKREAVAKADHLVPQVPLIFSSVSAHSPIAPAFAGVPFPAAPIQSFSSPPHLETIPAQQPLQFARNQFPLTASSALVQHQPAPIPLSTAPVFPQVPVNPTPLSVPSSQFHAQDEFGQFSFGYENINSKKTESKDAFGVTRGEYQYVDANGVLQIVSYVSDPVNGFRVSGTNLPVALPEAPVVAPLIAPLPVEDTPEVAAAKFEHLKAHKETLLAAEEN